MNIGISTGCFYPRTPLESIEAVSETGAKFTEIFFNTDSELCDNYVKKIKDIADKNNINVISVHPFTSAIETFMFFSRSDYKLEDSIKYYEKYFKACNILGAKYVVIHGCNLNADYIDMKRYCTILNLLSDKAREYGVYISQENATRFKCGHAENVIEFLKYANEDVKFTFDIKQAVRANEDIYAFFNLVCKRVSHLHISDFNTQENSLLPGFGNFELAEFLKYADEHSSAEAALIEVYEENLISMETLADSLNALTN